MFSTYQPEEKADLVLIYSILYIQQCLKKLTKCENKEKAHQDLYAHALKRFALPGDADFPLNSFYEKPKSSKEYEELKKYVTQLRQEIGNRLIEKVFDEIASPDGKPSKWWICFARKKFLKLELSD